MTAQVTASHILLMYKGSARSTANRTKDEALAEIADIGQQIAEGADFADMARNHSDCPSAQEGGDLGSFRRGMMVPEFDEAAFALEVGDVSPVIETAFGYHLIKRMG